MSGEYSRILIATGRSLGVQLIQPWLQTKQPQPQMKWYNCQNFLHAKQTHCNITVRGKWMNSLLSVITGPGVVTILCSKHQPYPHPPPSQSMEWSILVWQSQTLACSRESSIKPTESDLFYCRNICSPMIHCAGLEFSLVWHSQTLTWDEESGIQWKLSLRNLIVYTVLCNYEYITVVAF